MLNFKVYYRIVTYNKILQTHKIISLAIWHLNKVNDAWKILKSEFDDNEINLVTYYEENNIFKIFLICLKKKNFQ